MEVGHCGTHGNKREARQKGRKGECHVIKITKNEKKTEGYRRQLKEKVRMRQGKREGDTERERERGN